MAEQTEVTWPTCEQAGCIGIRLPSARMCLAHVGEEETAAALKLVSETGAIDARGVPITRALVKRILTAAPRGENEEPLIKGCRFNEATFTYAKFVGATFNQFDRVTFSGDAGFARRPSPATPISAGRPSPATPISAGRPSPATPSSPRRPSPTSPRSPARGSSKRAAGGPAGGQGPSRCDLHPAGCHRDIRAFREGAGGSELQGLWPHPLLAVCDNTGGEPLAWMLRRGSAGSNTAADHLALTDAAIAALPPGFRRKLMITADGAGASHDLIKHLDKLASRPGYQVIYSVGWALGEREKTALRMVPEQAWQIAIDGRGEAASAAPKAPARMRAARTGPAGSRKRTSPS